MTTPLFCGGVAVAFVLGVGAGFRAGMKFMSKLAAAVIVASEEAPEIVDREVSDPTGVFERKPQG